MLTRRLPGFVPKDQREFGQSGCNLGGTVRSATELQLGQSSAHADSLDSKLSEVKCCDVDSER